MSKIKITINTDNAAFEDYDEVPRILGELAKKVIEKASYELTVLDINGNVVGKMEVEE